MRDKATEQSVAGAIIYDGAKAMEILTRLKCQSEWFTDRKCRDVFKIGYDLFKDGQPISVLDFDHLGDDINNMIDLHQSIAHVESLAEKIKTCWLRRKIKKACTDLARQAENDECDIEEVRSKAELEISSLSTRQDVKMSNIEIIDTAIANWEIAQDKGQCIGVKTGFMCIDHSFGGLMRSGLIIFSGTAGSCKTMLARNIIEHVTECGHKVSFLSLEQTAEQIWGGILARFAKQSVFYLNGGHPVKANINATKAVREMVASLPLTVEERPHTRDEMMSWGRREVGRGAELLVVDYIQRVQANSYDKTDSEEQRIAKTSTALADLAKETGIPVLAISALSRNGQLRGSGILDYDAYCHLRMGKSEEWRPPAGSDEGNLQYEAYFEKARFGPTAGVTSFWLLGNENRLIEESNKNARDTLDV